MLIEEKHCYYCRSSRLLPAFEDVRDRLHTSHDVWQFHRCQSCASLMLSPRPDDASLAKFYPEDYTPVARADQAGLATRLKSAIEYWLIYRWIHRAQVKTILRANKRVNGKNLTLLDVGCGSGFFLKEATMLAFTATGCDQRESALTHVRQMLGIPAICTGAQTVSHHFSPASFDVISMFHIIEHLPDPLQALQECKTLLKPDGLLVIGVPVINSLQATLFGKDWCAIREAPRHLSVPSREGVRTLLEHAGFDGVEEHRDSIFLNATAYITSLLPACLQAAKPTNTGLTAQIHYQLMRLIGLIGAYAMLPVAIMEAMKGEAGQYIFTARSTVTSSNATSSTRAFSRANEAAL